MRFALLFDDRNLEAWHLRCLDQLQSCAELAGVITAPADSGRAMAAPSPLARWYGNRSVWPGHEGDRERLKQAKKLAFGGNSGRESLDFVLKLGRGPLPPGVEAVARFGVWHFEHETQGGELPFFRETCRGEDVTTARLLVRRAGSDRSCLLKEGRLRTEKRSYLRQRRQIESVVSQWPAHLCRRVSRVGFEPCIGEPAEVAVACETDLIEALGFVLRTGARRLDFGWRRFFRHPQWNVGVLRRSAGEVVRSGGYREEEVEWLPLENREAFLADPFGIARNGVITILCEYYGYRRGQGWIAALEWSDGRFRWIESRALQLDVHMSYPGLVEHEGHTYCVPETCQANEIALYRADSFPGRWTRVAALVDGFAGVDPTVFRHEGQWWLFCTQRGDEADAALWIWHAPDLLGPWTPHGLNPVKIDVSGTRPGGPAFMHEGALYRPTQDCSRYYGWRIVIQRVDRLTPTEFSESPACVLEAGEDSPYPCGRHTFTPVGEVVLVDGHREVFVWPAFCHIVGILARDIRAKVFRGAGRGARPNS